MDAVRQAACKNSIGKLGQAVLVFFLHTLDKVAWERGIAVDLLNRISVVCVLLD